MATSSSSYFNCDTTKESPNVDPERCPFHPEAGCTLLKNAYNVYIDGIEENINKLDGFMKDAKANIKRVDGMICNIGGLLLTDNNNNLVKIPVYTYKNPDGATYNVLPIDNCEETNGFNYTTYDDAFNNINEISYSQSNIDHELKILNVSSIEDDITNNQDKIRDACYVQQEIQNASIPVTKAEKLIAEQYLKIASNLSSQYSNDLAYNITKGVVDKNIPLQAYQTTFNTTPASIIGAIAIARVKGLFKDNNNNNGDGDNGGGDNGGYYDEKNNWISTDTPFNRGGLFQKSVNYPQSGPMLMSSPDDVPLQPQ